jgi:hypothetical protein
MIWMRYKPVQHGSPWTIELGSRTRRHLAPALLSYSMTLQDLDETNTLDSITRTIRLSSLERHVRPELSQGMSCSRGLINLHRVES